MLVRTESIITQLVFDHALRIRMQSDVSSDTPASSRATTAAHTPDNASIAEDASGSTEDETVRASTVSAGSTVAPKKGKDGKKGEEEKATPTPSADSGNLIGKINNLVTTDLNTLIDGRDFLFVSAYLAPFAFIDML